MTEKEIIQYLDNNAIECRAYKALPKEVQQWIYLHRHLESTLMALGPGGCWIRLEATNSCKPPLANMVFTVETVMDKERNQ